MNSNRGMGGLHVEMKLKCLGKLKTQGRAGNKIQPGKISPGGCAIVDSARGGGGGGGGGGRDCRTMLTMNQDLRPTYYDSPGPTQNVKFKKNNNYGRPARPEIVRPFGKSPEPPDGQARP